MKSADGGAMLKAQICSDFPETVHKIKVAPLLKMVDFSKGLYCGIFEVTHWNKCINSTQKTTLLMRRREKWFLKVLPRILCRELDAPKIRVIQLRRESKLHQNI